MEQERGSQVQHSSPTGLRRERLEFTEAEAAESCEEEFQMRELCRKKVPELLCFFCVLRNSTKNNGENISKFDEKVKTKTKLSEP